MNVNTIKVEINNGIVRNYYINKYDSGIISLTINTDKKWETYDRINDNAYTIGFDDVGFSPDEFELKVDKLEIPQYYRCISDQVKDQICFYWIPFELITYGKVRDKVRDSR